MSNLPVGDKYEIVVRKDQFPQQVIELNAMAIDSFVVLNVFADFTSVDYDIKNSSFKKSLESVVEKNSKTFDSKNFSEKYGNKKVNGLIYKVQVGAFKFFENFNYNLAMGMPKIIRQTDDDYITRFTMGNFETFNEAKALLEKVQSDNTKGAFIIGIYNGEKNTCNSLLKKVQ